MHNKQKTTGSRPRQETGYPLKKASAEMISIPTDRFSIETAEGEILATAILRPDLWARLQDVTPEWFTEWSDQQLWQAIQLVMETNLECADPNVIHNWLIKHWPDEAESLIQRLADHVGRWAHPEYLPFHLGVLRQNGIRLSCRHWSGVILKFCDELRPLSELQAVVTDPPAFEMKVTL